MRRCLLRRSDVKAEEDVETHSRSGTRQRSKQRCSTPELRLTRSMQPPAELQHPHNQPADQRRTGRSLPVKLEQQGATGEQAALHQGSSGSPGKGAGSSSQPGGQAGQRRGSKAVGKDADAAAVKAEVTSSRLRQSTAGGSTSGESQSHVDLAAACLDQGDAVGSSGKGSFIPSPHLPPPPPQNPPTRLHFVAAVPTKRRWNSCQLHGSIHATPWSVQLLVSPCHGSKSVRSLLPAQIV